VRAPALIRFGLTATGDGRPGKGVLGPVPIHLVAETGEFRLAKREKFGWEISFEVVK
jgi:hypothetical protein